MEMRHIMGSPLGGAYLNAMLREKQLQADENAKLELILSFKLEHKQQPLLEQTAVATVGEAITVTAA